MQDTVLVAEGSASQELKHEAADGHRVECATVAVYIHVLLEITFAVLEDEDELCFGVNDIVEADDVDVLELLHERDLADGGRRGPLLGIKVYFFEGNDLVRRS